MINQEYFLGLDIGTDSVGWAAANSEYHIIKKNGKALWGVRLFDSAQTAAERREYRIARRRIERRKQRLAWLQDQFAAEIAKKDPAFFRRLQESKFLEEDKQSNHPLGRYTLFADRNYCDKDYYRDYPTVYHLRKKLMEQPGPFDVRLVYLALHHIMKYRGHFLYGDLAMDSISLKAGMDRLNHVLEQEFEYKLEVSNMEALKEVLISRKGSKTWRKKCLAELLSVEKREDQMGFALAELLAGSSVPLDALFGDGTATEDFKKISLEDDFEEIVPKLEAALGDRIEVVLAAKGIHDWALLETMRDGERYISSAKVKSYQKHEDDLTLLKTVVRQLNDRDMYREIFHTAREKLNNYPAYSGKDANGCRCGYDDFRKYLTGKLKPYKDLYSDIPAILSEFEQGTFLPLQTTKDNGVIPHQLHEEELVKILGNASAYLPFLTQVDESGLTKAEQIHRMFCFRIPYYVGPLDSRSEHSWVVRKNDKVYVLTVEETTVTVKMDTELTITPSDTRLSGGGAATLTVSGLPEGAEVTVTCDDEEVTVSGSGTTFTAELPNSTKTYTFTATFDGNGTHTAATASCEVSATRRASSSGGSSSSSTTYRIYTESSEGGEVSVSATRARRGTTVTITVEPEDGYELDALTVTDPDGEEIDVEQRSSTRYTFEMPRSSVTVEAAFVETEDSEESEEDSGDALSSTCFPAVWSDTVFLEKAIPI